MKDEFKKISPMSLDLMLGIFAAAGVTAGVIISIGADRQFLRELCGVEQKLALAASGEWFGVFIRSFSGAALTLAAAFFLGFCALGQPAELLLSGFRGLGLGMCVRGVYLCDGVLRALLAFLPYAVVSTGIIILGCKEAYGLSMRYLRLSVTAENRLGIKNEIKDYAVKFAIYLLLLALAALTDALAAGAIGRI